MFKVVKEYVCKYLYSMGEWLMVLCIYVVYMWYGDFYVGEKLMILDCVCNVRMELLVKSGKMIVFKFEVLLDDGDVIDSMFMSKKVLCDFYEE